MKFFVNAALEQAEKRIADLVHDRAESTRRHNEEIERLKDMHAAHVAALQQTIETQAELNERLLRLSGVEPLANPSSVTAPEVPQSPSVHRPKTPTAEIIARDKERTFAARGGRTHEEYRSYLEQRALEIQKAAAENP